MDGDELSRHLIYNPSSPVFDIPDYIPLRRVKPLPKRKRSSPDPVGSLPLNAMLPPILPPPPGPDATAEELIAHAEVLSAQITFQSYFLPALSGAADFTRGSNVETPLEVPVDLDITPTEMREGDHLDQMQQQGNAKKRKVPAHLSGSQMGPDSSDVHSGEEEQPVERASPSLASPAETTREEGVISAEADSRRGKMLPATMVGLRQKEMLMSRKQQLAGVLGTPSSDDSLALDHALLANYALLNENRFGMSSRTARLKSRLMPRRASRVVRRYRTLPLGPPSEPTHRIFPDGEFTFLSLNRASERLVTMRTEYTMLYDRFEDELARQAEKAAESAKEIAASGTGIASTGAGSKWSERVLRKARAATQTVQDTETAAVTKSPGSTKTSGKKKKRSALANASNPHHLRNYVPSRIPNQGHLSAAQLGANAQNLLSPLPLVFLSAQIPPKRNREPRPLAAASQLANPAEEWICPTCEYRLFYGDEQGYRIGVRNRKKILKRRRRARERAAAAANGSGTGVGVHGKGSGLDDDEEDLDIETMGGSGLALSQATTRLGKFVEREKGGDREQRMGIGTGIGTGTGTGTIG
ncbi:hypothetical protein B0F90DRAFT_1666135 [Multifurca ochricompacta]|uniref:Uncharacterized protein n=1 Tax=Multifurca ochricompacta TaxID=376703 RepID=A0AAD4MBF6_9AGAM|nr:hypothetical protein B0F90DRAFT_1666135 [Multifurca ochricompacta]